MKKHFSNLQVWEDASKRTAAGHMSCDEAMAWCIELPVLRVYRWSDPAATFGYSQRFDELPAVAKGLNPVRRWTGGGVVYHGEDVTLALVVPDSEALGRERSLTVYRAIHEAWVEVVRKVLPSARLVIPEEFRSGGVCFENPVEYDIIDGMRKLCGGALRRFRGGVLYQGSLHCAEIAGWKLAEGLAGDVGRFDGMERIEHAAEVLEREKYGTAAWKNLR